MTVCAKSLTLPGDAVPCALGPEDTCEPSMTSKPESKASEQLQWDSFALLPAIRYVFKPMDKSYSQHRLKPPLVEIQLRSCSPCRTCSWKVKSKVKNVNMSYFTTDFHLFRDVQPQGDICLQATPFTPIMFSLSDGCTFYLWGLKWALKNSSFVTAAEPNDGGPSALPGFVFISQYQSLTYTMVGLVSRKGFRGWTILSTSPDIGKTTMKSETIICTHRGN